MTDINESDDELLAQTRNAVLGADKPPERLRDAAIRALTWDSEIETLIATFDSLQQPTAMRSATVTRDLTFGKEGLVVEISISTENREGTVVTGLISADVDQAVLVQPGAEDRTFKADEHGQFRLSVSGSLAGIVLTTTDGRRLRTELFSLDPTSGES